MDNQRTRALLIGGVLGAVVGTIAAWIYYNTNVEIDAEGAEALEAPTPGAAVKLGLGILGLMRLIAE
ncbi:MAG: hypothetical protein MUQ30_19200 [Anaerolineae bacterium]|nr:hypothetical protein [Anaerolineae bacterium]